MKLLIKELTVGYSEEIESRQRAQNIVQVYRSNALNGNTISIDPM